VEPLVFEAYKELKTKRDRRLLPKMDNIIRATNRARERLRPKTPTSLDFDFAANHIPPNFLKKDIKWVDRSGVTQRIVIFSTDSQLKQLARAKRWEVDATFQIVPHPFFQLLGIHTSIKKGSNTKSIPLVFALMSCKKKLTYIKFLRALNNMITPYGQLKLSTISIDFEAGLWQAFKTVFPTTKLQGCSFHFRQAVFRKLQECGLQTLYRRNSRIRSICTKLMSLNLLPGRLIPMAFESLKRDARGPLLKNLFQYYENNWIKSSIWSCKSWSVFMSPIRTNSPIESYHSRLKRLARKPELNLYLLIELLATESNMVPFKCFMLSTDKLSIHQRKPATAFTHTLFSYWESFNNGDYSDLMKFLDDLSNLTFIFYKFNHNKNKKFKC